jgi:enterochelin esterase-like enzyme
MYLLKKYIMNKIKKYLLAFCGILILYLTAAMYTFAQEPDEERPAPRRRTLQWGPHIVSPEIHPDNRVTFRLLAPKSTRVTISGEWMAGFGASKDLVKNDTGLWSITLGPLKPEYYGYSFNVDGVQVLDPVNPLIKRDGTRNASVLFVPGEESGLYEVQDVPHGTLSKVWYDAPTLNMTRRMYVYTPPGYEDSEESYPVFYLFHGAGGDEDAWTTLGLAPRILDNLIAQGKAKPMIVVMTNGNPFTAAAPGEAPALPPSDEQANAGPGSMGSGLFEKSLVNDVVPFIEKNYRVIANKDNRAIAGLSMGGLQTQNITNNNPEMFSYIGIMSMGLMNRRALGMDDEDQDFGEKLEGLKKSSVKLYWIGCGKEDFLFASVQTLLDTLDNHDFKYTYRESTGGHTWANWRIYLTELAPLLFK